jgi:transcription termination/antitermination protein NusG
MEAEENFHPGEEPETSGAEEPNDMQEATDHVDETAHEEEHEHEEAEHDEDEPVALLEASPEAAEPVAEAPVAEAPAEAGEPGGYDEASPKKWFIIHTYSGFENKVAESLKTRADAFGFADKIGQILIPTEEVVELRNGKKVSSKRLVYPGYVLVEMEMNDQLWHEVKNTPRVTGFVGGGTSPVPLSADEVNQILYRQQSSAERPRPKMTFEKNDSVRIVDGPFANFSGKVDEVNPERGTLRVMVTIFGRATPVELEFLQVEKV